MRNIKMKIALFVVLILTLNLITFSTHAQKNRKDEKMQSYFYLQPNIGVSQYFGDLNYKDYWNQHPKFTFGAVFGYQYCPVFGLRTQYKHIQRKIGSGSKIKFQTLGWSITSYH
jgi:hypothetical protein